jgi:hypothetical protein
LNFEVFCTIKNSQFSAGFSDYCSTFKVKKTLIKLAPLYPAESSIDSLFDDDEILFLSFSQEASAHIHFRGIEKATDIKTADILRGYGDPRIPVQTRVRISSMETLTTYEFKLRKDAF